MDFEFRQRNAHDTVERIRTLVPVVMLEIVNGVSRWSVCCAAVVLLAYPASNAPGQDQEPSTLDSLLDAGRQLWEDYVPEEIQEEYTFPGSDDVRAFLVALEADLEEGSFSQLAAYEPEARNALGLLRMSGAGEPIADWLEPRLDFLVAAGEQVSGTAPKPRARPLRPGETPPAVPSTSKPAGASAVSRANWERKLAGRAPPRRAQRLVPGLKKVFRDEGVPDQWVWLAEVESSMNPSARSPVGAKGLFQFMPATAERFGLSTALPDERANPEKSARAAATYMRILYRQFRSWPLVLAAYNAGEGRVGRLLRSTGGSGFDDISEKLPAETRMYVPKVLATVAIREGVDPEQLPAPRVAWSPGVGADDALLAVGNTP